MEWVMPAITVCPYIIRPRQTLMATGWEMRVITTKMVTVNDITAISKTSKLCSVYHRTTRRETVSVTGIKP